MKWVRFEYKGSPAFGILQNNSVSVTSLTWEEVLAGQPPNQIDVIAANKINL